MIAAHAHAYQRTQSETASPERLLVLLFQATRKHMAVAEESLKKGEPKGAEVPLRRAIDIVTELNATLDPRAAPALVEQLSSVYAFVLGRLFAASRGDQKALADARRAFNPIADAFQQVAGQTR
jgi:flagellar protein FliS